MKSMRKRRTILLLTGVVVVALVGGAFRSREPEYEGKRLSEWFDMYVHRTAGPEPARAIQAIGTNALPYLLAQICHYPSGLQTRACSALNQGIAMINPDWMLADPYLAWRVRYRNALYALDELGPKSKPVMPELIRFASEMAPDADLVWDSEPSYLVAYIGGPLGSLALPGLVDGLTNRSERVRGFSAAMIMEMGTNGRPAWLALSALVDDPNAKMRTAATNALRQMRSECLRGAAL